AHDICKPGQHPRLQRIKTIAATHDSSRRHRHLAIDVELPLTVGTVANPDGTRAFVAGQMRQLRFLALRSAEKVVDDLKLGPGQPRGMKHPAEKTPSLAAESEAHQSFVGQSGIPQPAVPVVPIPVTADAFRQRGGRSRDDSARVAVSEELE